MKLLILLALAAFASANETNYVDHLDMPSLIVDGAVVLKYVKCFHDAGPCCPLAEAYKTFCDKCDYSQKVDFWKFFNALYISMKNEADYFVKKYNADHKIDINAEANKYLGKKN